MPILPDAPRLAGAAAVVLAYAGLCSAVFLGQRNKRRRAAQAAATLPPDAPRNSGEVLLAYASQTGFAEELAERSAAALRAAGQPALPVALSDLPLERLARNDAGHPVLFLASTCGEGDAPDNAAAFVRRLLDATAAQPALLTHLRYGLLALGDREYRHFCGFGRRLDGWLQAAGATPLFERIEADNGDAAALERWQHALAHLAGGDDAAPLAWQAPEYAPWRLCVRRHLNPGSRGGPVFHLELAPPPGPAGDGAPECSLESGESGESGESWQSGDLLQVARPGPDGRLLAPREYSIASIPADGRVHLLVRQQRGPDGRLGAASGWLSEGVPLGGTVMARLRPHRNFRLGDNARRPLILIGNGTGLAGLRGHLRARAAATGPHAEPAPPTWLIFGERNAAIDYHYRDEIDAWRRSGLLQRLDLAFSRDQAEPVYVQHLLREAGAQVRDWLARDAAIYICGSAVGMAEAVHRTLIELIGEAALDELTVAGRYRRDVY